MDRIGNYRDNYDAFNDSGINDQNIVVLHDIINENGWITQIGVHAGGDGQDTTGRIILLDADGTVVEYSPLQTWSSVLAVRSYTLPVPRQMSRGTRYRVGFWTDPDIPRKWSIVRSSGLVYETATDTSEALMPQLTGFVQKGGGLAAWFNFVPNLKPQRGTWREAPSGTINNSQPTLSGRFHHSDAEESLDSVSVYRIRIYDRGAGRVVWTNAFDATQAENDQGYFERVVNFVHADGRDYSVWFNYMDKWEVWSEDSEHRQYSMGTGPARPVMITPSGKINWLNGADSPWVEPDGKKYIYRGEFTQRTPDPGSGLNAIQVRVWNRAKTRIIFDSGKRLKSGNALSVYNNGTNWKLDQFHATNFDPAKEYLVEARAWDTDDKVSEWSADLLFNTNAYPEVPSEPLPANNTTSSSNELSVLVRDPDGDSIQTVTFTVTDANGDTLAGYPVVRTGPFKSGDRVSYAAHGLGSNTAGNYFTWRAWANDGFLTSDHMAPQTFRYAQVPVVNLVAPSPATFRNLIENPGFEYSPDASRGWILDNASNSITYTFVEDGAREGKWALEAYRFSTSNPGGTVTSKKKPIDRTQPLFAGAWIKRTFNDADTTLRVVAYDAGGTVLGTYIPTDLAELSLDNPESYWKRYGGFVPANALPATTTQTAVQIIPSNSMVSKILIDDVSLYQLWAGIAIPNTLDWIGHFDGDTRGFGTEDKFKWDDTSSPATSASSGIPILTNPEPKVQITYSGVAGSTKARDKVRIEYEDEDGEWQLAHDSGWVPVDPDDPDNTRTEITLEPNVMENETHYRMQVSVEDTNGLANATGWVYFDTDYDGPAPMSVMSVGADIGRAEITMSWVETELDPLEFIAYELRVRSAEEGTVLFKRITDPTRTQDVYSFPLSGVEYTIEVRQVRAVGLGEVPGRWNGEKMTVDYFPFYFLKMVSDPSKMLAFDPERGSIPGRESNTEMDEYQPLHTTKPRHMLSNVSFSSGSFEASLWDDYLLPLTAEQYAQVVEEMAGSIDPKTGKLQRFAIFMGHMPSFKAFVVLKDAIGFATNEHLDHVISVQWSETYYEEDVIKRERIEKRNRRQ